MYCPKCGTLIEENPKFCNNCGSDLQNPNTPKKSSNGKRLYSFVAPVMCFILAGCLFWSLFARSEIADAAEADNSAAGFLNIPSISFDTPEAAIQHFSERIAANDMKGALQACAVDESGYYDFPNALERIGAHSANSKWPGKYDMYQDINRMSTLGNYAQRTKNLIWSLLIPELDWTVPLSKSTPEGSELMQDTSLFEKRLDPSLLSSLKVEQIASDYMTEEFIIRTQEIYGRIASECGAKSAVERGVLYRYKDHLYIGGYQLIESEHGWKIYEFSAPALGASTSSLELITMEEWNERSKR